MWIAVSMLAGVVVLCLVVACLVVAWVSRDIPARRGAADAYGVAEDEMVFIGGGWLPRDLALRYPPPPPPPSRRTPSRRRSDSPSVPPASGVRHPMHDQIHHAGADGDA